MAAALAHVWAAGTTVEALPPQAPPPPPPPLILPSPPPPPPCASNFNKLTDLCTEIDWIGLADNIIRSSLLASNEESYLFQHGLTIESDIKSLVNFFNNTAASSEVRQRFLAMPAAPQNAKSTAVAPTQMADETNPYRGAFAQVSQWKHQQGWESIVAAHSRVAVRCNRLYMEGGSEFMAKHCYWNVDALRGGDGSEVLRYPDPQWTIVEDCCERLHRPILQLSDAVWATTRERVQP